MPVTFISLTTIYVLLCFKDKCSLQLFNFPAVYKFVTFKAENWARFGSEAESPLHSFRVV
jgi:hypothetical protein